MAMIQWFQRSTEYLIGMTLVLSHLAFAGRGIIAGEILRERRHLDR